MARYCSTWIPGVVALLLSASHAVAQPSGAAQPGHDARPTPAAAPAATPFIYGGADSFAPWEYLDEWGTPHGFTVALVQALSRHTGRPVVISLTPRNQVLRALDEGTVDLAALGASDERRSRFDYLPLVWTLQQAVAVNANRTARWPAGWHEMASEVAAVEADSLLHERLKRLPGGNRPVILPTASTAEALRALTAGRATMAAGNALVLRRAIAQSGVRTVTIRDMSTTPYHFVTGRGRAREFDWLERALTDLEENGTFARLFEQYLAPPAPAPAISPVTWHIVAGSFSLLLLGTLAWSRRMRRVVAAKVQAEAISVRRREEAEEALRATERQMQQLVHSVKAIVWRMDVATERFTFVSQEAEQLLGYPIARWTEDAAFFPAMVHADDRDWVVRYCRRATRERRDHTMEYRVFSQDGRLVWLRDIVSVIVEDGVAQELIGVMVDISEYKAAEEALEASHAHALAATRAKSEFLASMSHEIRTPMNAVIGITDLLLDTPLTVDQRQFVETVRSSGDVLLNVINDILDFSKVESGKLEFERIDLDPEALADDVARLMGERATARGLDLTCRIAPDVPRNLIGDPGRLRQVLLNLVGNAIKFTERGDVAIRVTAPEVSDTQAVVRFEVRDTGIGISPEAQARLFDAFTQADASTTRRFGGTGLGLAIARRIIELLGGHIGLESVVGEGTTFWFTVPFARTDAAVVAPAVGVLGGMRVLVVDHSRASRVVLEQTLIDAGLTACSASCAEEAIAVVEAGAWPHVALIEEQLEGGGLARLVECLRERAPNPVAVVMMTSRPTGAPAPVDRTARLMKPVRRTELLAALELVGRPVVAEAVPAPVARAAVPGASHAAHVLVAEDNPVNQKVARLLLEKCGCRVDVVDNGVLAAEAVATGAYDMVLMDCQMPVCDGFEATRRIRALAPPASGIVVVALTANALSGDRERCLAAGMNDYLSKPVRRDALADMLARYLPQSTHAHPAA